jgi:hypothetical protein
MPGLFQKEGISFRYPENWQVTNEKTDTGWTVSVQSPDTGFFMLSYDTNMPECDLVVHTVLDAMRAEYPGLESDDALESLAGQPALGHDIRFFSLDLTNTCCTRSFYCDTGTILVMWQANDLDLEHLDPVFRAIRVSLRVEE